MREMTLSCQHLKRPLDIMRWFTTELLRFEAQISNRLKITEQEAVLHVLNLDEDAKLETSKAGISCSGAD